MIFTKNVKLILREWRESFSKDEFERNEHNWYYFLHIPKTAGTTFRYCLYEHFHLTEVYPSYKALLLKQNSRYLGWEEFVQNEKELFPMNKKLLIGHFGWKPLDHFSITPNVMTFVREPISRIKSSIIFNQKRNRRYKNMEIDEILNKFLVREGMTQARNLGFHPKKDNLSQALENLEKIKFIGLSEEFKKSIEVCNNLFNWNLTIMKKRNVGKYSEDTFTESQIDRISEACRIDNLIYTKAQKLFNSQYLEITK